MFSFELLYHFAFNIASILLGRLPTNYQIVRIGQLPYIPATPMTNLYTHAKR